MDKEYYIGLDIGTESIGWAVSDLEYRLIKKGGRDFWGVYLFDKAETAAERRGFRTARRRTARTHHRLMLLQELFAEEIERVDPTFFLRLKNSALYLEDKDERLNGSDTLFADESFTDKDYHKRFPTVYHLRAHLLENPAEDIRFLYLAIHHIIKNRGHFLFEAQNFNAQDTQNVMDIFTEMNTYLSENEYAMFETQNVLQALDVIKGKGVGILDKTRQLKNLFAVGKNKQLEAAIKAMVGGKIKLKTLYPDLELEDTDVCLAKESFDEEVLPNIESQLGDDVSFIKNLKAIYDWSVLSAILGEEKYISMAKIKTYEKHKLDLARLKALVRAQDSDGTLYRKVFKRQEKVNNYAAYIGMDNKKGFGKCKKKDFYDFLKKTLKLDEYITQEIEKEDFLPKQVSNANGVIPYQVHLAELQQILACSVEKYPFLNKEEEGQTVTQKIQSLMTFRIPYYVGPLHTASRFAWAKRNEGYENLSITPWNFDKAIDKDASEEEFIRRMTSKCTYLVGEDVLPASSLVYSEFAFLNELNNLKVNGQHSAEAKRVIYEYARTHKKITLSACLKLLKEGGMVEKTAKKEEVFSGLDGDFHTSMSTYVAFKEIVGDIVDLQPQLCEEIIERITITSADKGRLEQILKAKYGKILTAEQIKKLKGLNYVKWGKLSAKLLTDFYTAQCCSETGELLSILEVMRQTNKNFMQIIHEYGFEKAIREYNDELSPMGKINYKAVEELYCSPSVKRAIWRTLDLVKEITKLMGGEPKKIFIEMARDQTDNGKKGKRTTSRKQQILDLYASIKDEERDWIQEIDGTEDTKFNSKKLVLYYMQRGICMYSGKKIPLEYVFNTNVCDIEHIYPQSKIKDDSFDNTILVYKTENAKKSDTYPIDGETQSRMYALWSQLKAKGFISEKKYERLIRKTPLTQEELTDFINRQLVETRQSTKAVAELLSKAFTKAEIVYAKAGNADDFKQQFGLVKVRELNDLHHAKDAFINIVVGNVYNTKFNHNAQIYFKTNGLDSYNIKYLYARDIPTAWSVDNKEEIFKTYRKNTCRVVRFTADGTGALYNATIKTKREGLIPLKENGALQDTSKYGGYDSATTAYFMLVKGKGKKGKTVLSLEAVSIYQHLHCGEDPQKRLAICEANGLTDCEIVVDHIKPNTLLQINGSYAYIRGKTGVQIVLCNATELILPEAQVAYLKKISNCFRDKKKYFLSELPVGKEINAEENLALYDALIEKLSSPVYAGLNISGQASFLIEKREAFSVLSLGEQAVLLFEVLKLMQCNSTTADFTLIGGGGRSGVVGINKQIQDKQVKIILQSPTGHYRKIINCADFL